jgi:hypothetical protein
LQIWTAWSGRFGRKAGKRHGNMIVWSGRFGRKAGKKHGSMIAWSGRSGRRDGKKGGSWTVAFKLSPAPGEASNKGEHCSVACGIAF